MPDTSADRVNLSRQALYEQVWSTPMSRLSSKYGLSDSGLGKICKKHDIPRPPRGHWSRLRDGKQVRVVPLPKLDDERLATVILLPTTSSAPGQADADKAGAGQASNDRRPMLVVPDTLDDPHPIVAKTLKSLTLRKPGEKGMVWARGEGALDILCSPASVPRAMRIMHAVITALEDQDAEIVTKHGTRARIQGVEIPFYLREDAKRRDRELSAEEKRRQKRGFSISDRFEYTPTGRLALFIKLRAEFWAEERFGEGKRTRLEEKIPSFLDALHRIADQLGAWRLRYQDEQRRRCEEEKRQAERQRQIDEEKRHLAGLFQEVDRWHRSQQIRAFVKDVIERHEKANGPIQAGSRLHQWIQWATHHADRFDPLIKSPPSILDG